MTAEARRGLGTRRGSIGARRDHHDLPRVPPRAERDSIRQHDYLTANALNIDEPQRSIPAVDEAMVRLERRVAHILVRTVKK